MTGKVPPSKSFVAAQKVFNPRQSQIIPLNKNRTKIDEPLRFQENSSGIKSCKKFVPHAWRPQVCNNCFFYENCHFLPQKQNEQPKFTIESAIEATKDMKNDGGRKSIRKSVIKENAEEIFESKAEVFEMVDVLGFGRSGSVYYAKKMHTDEFYAIKFYEGPTEQDEKQSRDFKAIINNINVMRENTNCPFLVEYNGCYTRDNGAFMVMENCMCSVGDILQAYPDFKFKEEEIASLLFSTLNALKFLHDFGMIHRNIKPTSVLLKKDGSVKVADFAITQNIEKSREKIEVLTASPFWVAPEVIEREDYSYNVDVWSCGILALEMAEHFPPHHELSALEALMKIKEEEAPKLKDSSQFSPEFVEFLSLCLQKDPKIRKSPSELLEHPFIVNVKENSSIFTNLFEKLPDLQTRKRKFLEKTYEIDYESYKGTVLTVDKVNYTASLYERNDRIVKWIEAASKNTLKRPTYGSRTNTMQESSESSDSKADPEVSEEFSEENSENSEKNGDEITEEALKARMKRDSYYKSHAMKPRSRADVTKKLGGFRKATLTSATAPNLGNSNDSTSEKGDQSVSGTVDHPLGQKEGGEKGENGEEGTKTAESDSKFMQKSVSADSKFPKGFSKARPQNWNSALPTGSTYKEPASSSPSIPISPSKGDSNASSSYSSTSGSGIFGFSGSFFGKSSSSLQHSSSQPPSNPTSSSPSVATPNPDGISLPGELAPEPNQSGTWGTLRGKFGIFGGDKQNRPPRGENIIGFLKNPFGSLRGFPSSASLPDGSPAPKPVKFFGVTLEESIASCKMDGTPHICYTMIQYLQDHALDVEGIFRISGDQIKLNELKKRIKEGEDVELSEYSIHVISGVLKGYFRELPEPLLTITAYQKFIEAAQERNEQKKIQMVKDTLETIPKPNQNMLYRLIKFLSKAAEHSERSLMNSENLARCFAPNLLNGGKDENPSMMLLNSPQVNGIVETMISKQEKIFDSFQPEEQ